MSLTGRSVLAASILVCCNSFHPVTKPESNISKDDYREVPAKASAYPSASVIVSPKAVVNEFATKQRHNRDTLMRLESSATKSAGVVTDGELLESEKGVDNKGDQGKKKHQSTYGELVNDGADQGVEEAPPGSPATLIEAQGALKPSGSTTETSHEDKPIRDFIVGIIMVVFSFPLLWLNEKRSAQYEALVTVGEQKCREVSADSFDANNTNWLVHVTGDTVSTKPVQDEEFNVRYESGVIRLSSVVEIWQWV